jgi:long-chain acyl-CoA synthetase
LSKIRDALGGRVCFVISGAAPLNQEIAEFHHACGITILEGIGMTENTSFSNVNRIDANKFGTVGPTGEGIEMRLASDGEVMFRGDNVMLGYYKDPTATANALRDDGWLLSGDIGEIDEDGYLKITDRKKDLIVTAGGKNIAPQRIERIIRTSPFIANILAYGDKRKYVSALITLDAETISEWAVQKGLGVLGLPELADHPRVHELIRSELDARNEQLASFESVKKFHLLPHDFTIEAGELTPTLKLKRKVVIEKYWDALEALY